MNPRPGGARRANFPKRSITPTSEVETVNGIYNVIVIDRLAHWMGEHSVVKINKESSE